MPNHICNCEKDLFRGIKSILSNSGLKTFEKMILIVLKVYQEEYGDVFPDYETLATAGGMCKRKAQYVVKDLESRNMIEKYPRYKNAGDGVRKQTSNRYVLLSNPSDFKMNSDAQYASNAQHASLNDSACAQDAPYKSVFNNQDSFGVYSSTEKKEDDEEYIKRARANESQKYARYADVYAEMIKDQGTGVLSYKQSDFLDACLAYQLPACLVRELYPQVKDAIQQYHYMAIPRTIEKFARRLAKNQIENPVSWFVTTFRNEDIMVRTERELALIGLVG